MHSELQSISKIFTENLFRIPDYQRGYSWTEKQLKEFWTDIEQLEKGKNHYTGVLTLEEVPAPIYSRWDDDLWIINSRRYNPFYIVDGQQRLTTIIIALQTILERFDSDAMLNYTLIDSIKRKFFFDSKDRGISRSYIFGYEKDNPSYEFLKTKIFLEQSDNHSTAEETIYTQNLWKAKEFFKNSTRDFSNDALEFLYTKLTQNLLFNIYTISEEIDVFVAFETMNNRGKPLSHLELLKNRLIFLSIKFSVDNEEKNKLRVTINESWKAVYHFLGKNKLNLLDDDFFLNTHFKISFLPNIIEKNDMDESLSSKMWKYHKEYKEHLLNNIFTIKRMPRIVNNQEISKNSLSIREIYEYAKDIKRVVEIYYYLHNPADTSYSDKERISLDRLGRLGVNDCIAIMLVIYIREENNKDRGEFLELLERVKFISKIKPYIANIDQVNFDAMTIRYISGNATINILKQELKDYLEIIFDKVDFKQIFADWGKNRGYYGWSSIRYFLFEYEQELRSQSKTKRQKLLWDDFSKEDFQNDFNTVEHVYPQKVTHNCWKDSFNQYSIKQRNILKNSIGNLIPLSKPKNSSLGNKCFEEKKGNKKNKVGYFYGCYSENEVAIEATWTAKEILDRGIRMLEFMERRWDIPLGDKEDKIKALSLDFI